MGYIVFFNILQFMKNILCSIVPKQSFLTERHVLNLTFVARLATILSLHILCAHRQIAAMFTPIRYLSIILLNNNLDYFAIHKFCIHYVYVLKLSNLHKNAKSCRQHHIPEKFSSHCFSWHSQQDLAFFMKVRKL